MLFLLDRGYRHDDRDAMALAQAVMMGPVWNIATELPRRGAGLPFDPLSLGFQPALGELAEHEFLLAVTRETAAVARSLAPSLPAGYPLGLYDQILDELRG